MTEYADDHLPANPKPLPLMVPPVLPPAPSPSPTLDDMVRAIRSLSTRERAAKAVVLENEALQMERRAIRADSADAADLIQTAARLREVAAAVRPPWGEA